MKERPILLKAHEVVAIIEGRKTQTRRIIKPQCELTEGSGFSWKGWLYGRGSTHNETVSNFSHKCPHGQIGDRLWVRETFVIENTYDYHGDHIIPNDYRPFKIVEHCDGNYWLIPHYRATEPEPHIVGYDYDADDDKTRWKPSIHMPRWASRITLEITNVRVERLNGISEADAQAEGAHSINFGYGDCYELGFKQLWESINGEGSWEANPWVWVIEFKRIEREE